MLLFSSVAVTLLFSTVDGTDAVVSRACRAVARRSNLYSQLLILLPEILSQCATDVTRRVDVKRIHPSGPPTIVCFVWLKQYLS